MGEKRFLDVIKELASEYPLLDVSTSDNGMIPLRNLVVGSDYVRGELAKAGRPKVPVLIPEHLIHEVFVSDDNTAEVLEPLGMNEGECSDSKIATLLSALKSSN